MITSSECQDKRHSQCSRDPNRMPSYPILAVCECPCHNRDNRDKRDKRDKRRQAPTRQPTKPESEATQ